MQRTAGGSHAGNSKAAGTDLSVCEFAGKNPISLLLTAGQSGGRPHGGGGTSNQIS